MPSSSGHIPFTPRPKLSIHSASFYGQPPQPVLSGAFEIEIFTEDNPGPSFEEVFPEYAFANPLEGSTSGEEEDEDGEEVEEVSQAEYYRAASADCSCCKGMVYNCEGNECHFEGICHCVGENNLERHYFHIRRG